MTEGFAIPARRHRVEEVIRRSRFITTLAHTPHAEAAKFFLEAIREEFPDASHHCWAFVAGPPGTTGSIGLGDDGEPHGTAGRPMLTALLHSNVGEICAVSARYFGGTKLGTGGLARAYAGGVKEALLGLPKVQKILRELWRIRVDYTHIEPLRRLCVETGALVEAEAFGADVVMSVRVPIQTRSQFEAQLTDLTGGTALVIHRPEETPET